MISTKLEELFLAYIAREDEKKVRNKTRKES